MTIQVNNTAYSFEKVPTLQSILEHLEIQPEGIALAVNENIITKSLWAETTLKNQDQILIIKATQGG
jgi:sulfur carrier protein